MQAFAWTSSAEGWVALLTLTFLEVVLGIDNIIFISILAGKLPKHDRERARVVGLSLAMFIRIALLLSITWVMGLTSPLFAVFAREISGRDLILLAGGLFLIGKSTHEIHSSLEGEEAHEAGGGRASFTSNKPSDSRVWKAAALSSGGAPGIRPKPASVTKWFMKVNSAHLVLRAATGRRSGS